MTDANDTAIGFSPIERSDARTLILGSMPGQVSLNAKQYYANSRNAFWKILSVVCEIDNELSYSARVEALKNNGIALWDVLERCTRPGSLDSAINLQSAAVNDFGFFLDQHRAIVRVFFNGSMAEQLFRRRVLPTLDGRAQGCSLQRLPSTSPAYAAMPYEKKLAIWSAALTN